MQPLHPAAALVLAACLLRCSPVHALRGLVIDANKGPIGAAPQTLLPPLSTFVKPGAIPGNPDNVTLGNTTFRWAG